MFTAGSYPLENNDHPAGVGGTLQRVEVSLSPMPRACGSVKKKKKKKGRREGLSLEEARLSFEGGHSTLISVGVSRVTDILTILTNCMRVNCTSWQYPD